MSRLDVAVAPHEESGDGDGREFAGEAGSREKGMEGGTPDSRRRLPGLAHDGLQELRVNRAGGRAQLPFAGEGAGDGIRQGVNIGGQ